MSPEKKAPAASASVDRAASRSAPKRAKSATGGTGAGPSPKAAGRSKAASASPAKKSAAVKEAPVKGAAAGPPAPAPKAKASKKAPSAKSTAPKRAPAGPEKAPAAKPAPKKPAAPPKKPAAPAEKAPAAKPAPKKPTAPAKKAPAPKAAPKKPAAPAKKAAAPAKKAVPAKEPVRPVPKAAAAPAKPRGPIPSPFAVGDKVVYPHHGAAVIVRKERGEFQGQRTDYFVLEVATDQLTLKVPVPNAVERGVRPVISRAMARKVLATFKEPPEEAGANWSRWYKLLTEKINSGDIFQVAEVVRDLTFAQQTKGISPALKRMLSKARLILASELRFALDVSEEESMRRLDKALPKLELVEEF
jgi:CarD family transcriptional regulator